MKMGLGQTTQNLQNFVTRAGTKYLRPLRQAVLAGLGAATVSIKDVPKSQMEILAKLWSKAYNAKAM